SLVNRVSAPPGVCGHASMVYQLVPAGKSAEHNAVWVGVNIALSTKQQARQPVNVALGNVILGDLHSLILLSGYDESTIVQADCFQCNSIILGVLVVQPP